MINRIILQGRLVSDPAIKYTPSNVAMAQVSVAWSDKYKESEKLCYLPCKAWGHTAEFLNKWFHKGQETIVEGRMITEEWETDGKKNSRLICLVDSVSFCGSKSDSNAGYQRPVASQPPSSFKPIHDNVDDEGLPFN